MQNGEKAPKKKKTPEEIALKKALKAEASHALPAPITNQAATYNTTNAMHPTFDYNMQSYGNATMDYNNCGANTAAATMSQHPQMAQTDPNAMYYNDQMIKYESTQSVQPYQTQTTATNYHTGANDFTNQYYMQPQAPPVQQDTGVCWNNMQMYNNGGVTGAPTGAPGVDNMNYYGNTTAGTGLVGDTTGDKHQQQLMNIPNTDLFYSQDNLWNHHHQQQQPDAGAAPNHHPHHHHQQVGNTYNNIGNILTNLELIGNNSNFENNFDIVTSQGMGQPGVQPDDPQQQQQQANMADYQLFDYAPGFMKAPFE